MSGAWKDNDTRELALTRLRESLQAGQLSRFNTPFFVILQGCPPRDAPGLLGIPVGFTFLVDWIFTALPRDYGPQWAMALCENIQLQADLTRVFRGVMLEMLRYVCGKQSSSEGSERDVILLKRAMVIVELSIDRHVFSSEEAVQAILALRSQDPIVDIVRSAVNAVCSRLPEIIQLPADTREAMRQVNRLIDADTGAQRASEQDAGVFASNALAAAADFVAQHGRRLASTNTSEGPGDRANDRIGEADRAQFIRWLADVCIRLVGEALLVKPQIRVIRRPTARAPGVQPQIRTTRLNPVSKALRSIIHWLAAH